MSVKSVTNAPVEIVKTSILWKPPTGGGSFSTADDIVENAHVSISVEVPSDYASGKWIAQAFWCTNCPALSPDKDTFTLIKLRSAPLETFGRVDSNHSNALTVSFMKPEASGDYFAIYVFMDGTIARTPLVTVKIS